MGIQLNEAEKSDPTSSLQVAAILAEAGSYWTLFFFFFFLWSSLSLGISIPVYFPRILAKMMKTAFELEGSMVRAQIKRHLKVGRRDTAFLLNLNVQKNQ